MRKKIVKFSILPVFAGSMFFSFSPKKTEKFNLDKFITSSTHLVDYTVSPEPEENSEFEVRPLPELGNSYFGFKEAVGFKESGGNYKALNEYGYMGKYQFGKGTLALIGIHDTLQFINSAHLQEAAFYANAARNKWILRRDIKRFVGKEINGVEVTESGILAAAHLAGPGSVKKYLRTWGAQAFSDAFGTTIKIYMRKFHGFDTSYIKPERFPKVVIQSA